MKPELFDNLPAGTLVEKSARGFMTNELFKVFLRHLAKYKTPGKCLLIFDGAACHLDLSIVEISESLDIVLYCLPSNKSLPMNYNHWIRLFTDPSNTTGIASCYPF